MYIPDAFQASDSALVLQLIRDYGFATLIHIVNDEPIISHIPLYLDHERDVLTGHLAVANPHSQWLDGRKATVIFQGPHDYISTELHTSTQGVPTWNYAVVHVQGISRMITDAAHIDKVIRQLMGQYESTPLNQARFDHMKRGIVFFEIPMTHIEAKFKLSQNRPKADQTQVINAMSIKNPALAQLMNTALFDSSESK